MTGATVVPPYRLVLAREQRRLRQEQRIIEACERALETRPQSMEELIRRARVDAGQEGRRP